MLWGWVTGIGASKSKGVLAFVLCCPAPLETSVQCSSPTFILSPSVDIECIYFAVSLCQLCSAKCVRQHVIAGGTVEAHVPVRSTEGEVSSYSRQKRWIEAEGFCHMPTSALQPAMLPEQLDPRAPLLHRHVLFSARRVLENQAGSNPSK